MEKMIPMSAVDARLQEIGAEREKLTEQRNRLDVEEAMLRRLRENAIPFRGPTGGMVRSSQAEGGNGSRGKGATDAVLELVGESPGIRRDQVLDRLESTVNTGAAKVRRMLSNTIFRLEQQGRIVKQLDGGLSIAPGRAGRNSRR